MIPRKLVAVALGSNLGDREGVMRQAIKRLEEDLLQNTKSSSFIETEPWGITDQPKFLNGVVIGETEWEPPAIVSYLKSLERELGRTQSLRNGPRLIDLDLLLWGDETWHSDGVEVPHPGLQTREFVLRPLVELLPAWKHPVIGKTVKELVNLLPHS